MIILCKFASSRNWYEEASIIHDLCHGWQPLLSNCFQRYWFWLFQRISVEYSEKHHPANIRWQRTWSNLNREKITETVKYRSIQRSIKLLLTSRRASGLAALHSASPNCGFCSSSLPLHAFRSLNIFVMSFGGVVRTSMCVFSCTEQETHNPSVRIWNAIPILWLQYTATKLTMEQTPTPEEKWPSCIIRIKLTKSIKWT